MKEKKYDESTETLRDLAKMNLASNRVWRLSRNYFEPCHKITSGPQRLLCLPHRCIESVVCPQTDIVFPHNAKCAKDKFLSMLTLLPVVLLILFIFPRPLLFNEIKQSPTSFRSAASTRHN